MGLYAHDLNQVWMFAGIICAFRDALASESCIPAKIFTVISCSKFTGDEACRLKLKPLNDMPLNSTANEWK